jgi:hypothetical protein
MLLPFVESDEDEDDDDASPTALGTQPMGAMQQRRQPLLLTVWSMGATPPWHHLLLSACRPMGAICRRKEMPWMLVPLATKWVPTGDGATATPSIPPVQQSTLFPIFQRGNA